MQDWELSQQQVLLNKKRQEELRAVILRAKAVKWDIIRSKRDEALQEQQCLRDKIERAQRWFHMFSYYCNLKLAVSHVNRMVEQKKLFNMVVRRSNYLKKKIREQMARRKGTAEARI